MKILFLDIDGVLNTDSYLKSLSPYWKEPDLYLKMMIPEKVNLLNLILEKVEDLKIVISSDWRHAAPDGVTGLKRALRKNGASEEVIGAIFSQTPMFFSPCRTREISSWLDNHHKVYDYERIVILDDLETRVKENSYYGHKIYVAKTTLEHGLTDEIASNIIESLNN